MKDRVEERERGGQNERKTNFSEKAAEPVFLLVNDGLTVLSSMQSVGLFAFRSGPPPDRHMAFMWQPQESVGG